MIEMGGQRIPNLLRFIDSINSVIFMVSLVEYDQYESPYVVGFLN
jgi:hypothetical protein